MFSHIGEGKAVMRRSRFCQARCHLVGYRPLRVLSHSPIPIIVNRSNLPKIWTRGLKRKATIRIKDLPQGPLPPKAAGTVAESDGPAYPTVIQQARNNMRKFSHCVVLTRVGNFYEVIESFLYIDALH